MSRTTLDRPDPCPDPATKPGCARPALERLRFWNGRFLVARDLRDQQDDLIRRLEYHQHFAHGEGILCGFQVREHPRESCRDRWLVVDPGMGYDCCGRTLWSPECQAVEFPAPPPPPEKEPDEPDRDEDVPRQEEQTEPPKEDKPRSEDSGRVERRGRDRDRSGRHDEPQERDREQRYQEEEQKHPGHHPHEPEPPEPMPEPQWFILACHAECPVEPVPALYADDLCDPIRHEHGRMRESVTLTVVPASEVSEECWPRHRGVTSWDCTEPYEDDCGDTLRDAPPCSHRCVCGECLVLAAVWRDPRTGRLLWSTEHRKLLAPAGNLTRITGLSWPHGGEVSTEDLLRDHDGALLVRFSRRLRPAEGLRSGINMMTFTVSFLGPTRGYEQIIPPEPGELPDRHDTPRLSPNGRCAVFDLPRDMLTGRIGYGGTYLHIRLLCDFLVDCHGRIVSGGHPGGDVNRVSAREGGVFESWFYLRSGWRGERR
jgi:hypothetical protein